MLLKLTASGLFKHLDLFPESSFGALEVKMETPRSVLRHTRPLRSLYLWDRFDMGCCRDNFDSQSY